MAKTRRSFVQFGGLLLTIASLMHGNLPTSYAQSSSGRAKNLYFIMGAVKSPGAYQIESNPSLLKLVALAGGLEDRHGAVAFIFREVLAQTNQYPSFRVIQVRIDDVLKGNLEANAVLEQGDIVNIPPAPVFFVAGEVVKPGSFPFKEGITLRQAISDAGGLRVSAKGNKSMIFRQDPSNGNKLQIAVDLDAVINGKQKDIPLLPNDIVVVPNSQSGVPLRRYIDTPPIPGLAPCRGARPCIARSRVSLIESPKIATQTQNCEAAPGL